MEVLRRVRQVSCASHRPEVIQMRKLTLLCVALVSGCLPAASTGGGAPTQRAQSWPVLTRKHVDLWLHGYAMLLRDTATIPVFRRGYRERIETIKAQRNVRTLLDANRERLQSRLAVSPALASGQFAPMYFSSFDQMRQIIGLFLQAQGNPGATNDPTLRQFFAVLASSFPAAEDREWLRLFTESLEDERQKFYEAYWTSQNGARLGVVRAADSLWQG